MKNAEFVYQANPAFIAFMKQKSLFSLLFQRKIAPAGSRWSGRSSFLPISAYKTGHLLVQNSSAQRSLKVTSGRLRTTNAHKSWQSLKRLIFTAAFDNDIITARSVEKEGWSNDYHLQQACPRSHSGDHSVIPGKSVQHRLFQMKSIWNWWMPSLMKNWPSIICSGWHGILRWCQDCDRSVQAGHHHHKRLWRKSKKRQADNECRRCKKNCDCKPDSM